MKRSVRKRLHGGEECQVDVHLVKEECQVNMVKCQVEVYMVKWIAR